MSVTLPSATEATFTTLAVACAVLMFAGGAQAQGHGGRGGAHYAHNGGSDWHGGGGHYAPRYNRGGYGYGYGYGRGGNGWGWGWGGVGLGLGLGVGLGIGSYYNNYPYPNPYSYPYDYGAYADRGYVVVDQTVLYEAPQSVYSRPVPARVYSNVPQPVIYPRNGQSAAKMDADANACSQWAGQQPNATTDGSVFQRGTQACMDARGYTVR